ncbi:SCO family protein [Ammonicoccus fulvus]|uniref:SCO family protein n=1 Tax=Ammonicoccus fulvus TaxID=3138240 RepID=A0ABZ3FMY2_9ACTN
MARCLVGLVVLAVVMVTGCAAPSVAGQAIAPKADEADAYHGTWLDQPFTMPDVALTDTAELPYNLRTSPTTPVSLLYLGYPDCPDVCNSTLGGLAGAFDGLSPDVRDDITVLVVDIDADRGSSKQLKRWLAGHGEGFVGLRGTSGQIREIADAVGVEMHEPGPDGVILHSAQIIGFDRHHRATVLWTPDLPADALAADLQTLVAAQR